MPGRLIIICGLPGSGKTTLSRQLAATRQAFRLSPDEWMDALGVNLWASDVRARIEALQWDVAQDLLRLGTIVIIEWGTSAREERDVLREGARRLGAAVELHHLDVSVDELWRRVQNRHHEDPPIERALLEQWAESFQKPDAEESSLFDTPPDLTPGRRRRPMVGAA